LNGGERSVRSAAVVRDHAAPELVAAVEQSRGEHSAKPEAVLEMIEAYFPTLPNIELNRRGPPRPE
jgi:hypothetical protein